MPAFNPALLARGAFLMDQALSNFDKAKRQMQDGAKRAERGKQELDAEVNRLEAGIDLLTGKPVGK